MIKVNIYRSPVNGDDGVNEFISMPAVPRVGESVEIDHIFGTVEKVIWTPGKQDHDVQVRIN